MISINKKIFNYDALVVCRIPGICRLDGQAASHLHQRLCIDAWHGLYS